MVYQPDDSVVDKPHVGGWRGAANALTQLKSFGAVPGAAVEELETVEVLWLPSVVAMTDEEAQAITSFAERGGFVLATGAFPGVLDDLGTPRGRAFSRHYFSKVVLSKIATLAAGAGWSRTERSSGA